MKRMHEEWLLDILNSPLVSSLLVFSVLQDSELYTEEASAFTTKSGIVVSHSSSDHDSHPIVTKSSSSNSSKFASYLSCTWDLTLFSFQPRPSPTTAHQHSTTLENVDTHTQEHHKALDATAESPKATLGFHTDTLSLSKTFKKAIQSCINDTPLSHTASTWDFTHLLSYLAPDDEDTPLSSTTSSLSSIYARHVLRGSSLYGKNKIEAGVGLYFKKRDMNSPHPVPSHITKAQNVSLSPHPNSASLPSTTSDALHCDGESQVFIQVVKLGENVCGHPGIVHGGLLAALFDDVMGSLFLINVSRLVLVIIYGNRS